MPSRFSAVLLAVLAAPTGACAEGLYDYLFDPGTLPLGEVIGMQVLGPEGRPLGRIQALLYDGRTGAAGYVALERGAYPVRALRAADLPGQVLLDSATDDEPLASAAGATALRAETARAAPPGLMRAGAEDRLVLDLNDGRLRSAE